MTLTRNVVSVVFRVDLCILNRIFSFILVPIVHCAQCPSCKTYVPVPASILESLNEIPDVKPSSTLTNRAKTPASNRFSNRSYTPYSASITRKPSVNVKLI